MKDYILKEPIKKYIDSLHYERKLSVNTVNSYEENLYLFQKFLKNKELFNVTNEDILAFLKK